MGLKGGKNERLKKDDPEKDAAKGNPLEDGDQERKLVIMGKVDLERKSAF